MPFTEAQIAMERDKHEGWLSSQDGVTGIGIGLDQGGQPCLKIYTDHMRPATKESILAKVTDVPVDFEETGAIQAF